MTVQLSAEAMAPIVHQAILDKITPEQRDQLVSEAIASLLTVPKRDQFGGQKESPLNAAFKMAIETVAVKVVREQIEEDPKVQQAIKDLISPTIVDLCEGNYDGLPEVIGEAIGKWLRDRARTY